MTREEAIECLRLMRIVFEREGDSYFTQGCDYATRNIKALDEVYDYLKSRIDETDRDMEEDSENREWYLGYWQGLNEAIVVITHLKEVEE